MNPYLMIFQREMTPIRKLLLMHLAAGGKLTEYTVTGNPVSFDTNVAKPLSVLSAFTPVQSGTGDPSPENIRPITGWTGASVYRTGVNVWDEETELGGVNSSTGQEYPATGAIRAKNYIPIVPGASYYLKTPSMSGFTGCWYDKDKNYISTRYGVNQVMTAPQNACFFRFCLPTSYGTTYGNDISINYPSTDTEYHAYSGSSYSETFPALGNNLCPPLTKGIGLVATTGKETEDVTRAATDYIPVSFANGAKYTLSGITDQLYSTVWAYNAQKQGLGRTTSGQRTSITLAANSFANGTPQGTGEIAYIRFQQAEHTTGNSINLIDNCKYMLNAGETAMPYELYNTAYGGTLDLTTGVLTVEWAACSLKWSEGINPFSTGDNVRKKFSLPVTYIPASTKTASLCDIAKWSWNAESDNIHFYTTGALAYVFLPSDTDGNTEINICGNLATPLVYQLTPQEIQTLIGTNVLWSDTNGDIEVKYLKKG